MGGHGSGHDADIPGAAHHLVLGLSILQGEALVQQLLANDGLRVLHPLALAGSPPAGEGAGQGGP